MYFRLRNVSNVSTFHFSESEVRNGPFDDDVTNVGEKNDDESALDVTDKLRENIIDERADRDCVISTG